MLFFMLIVEEKQKLQVMFGEEKTSHIYKVQKRREKNGYSGYNTSVTLSKDELIEKLKESYPKIEIDLQKEDEIKILEYTQSQRARTVKIGNVEIAGTKLRQVLGLRSTNFNIEVNGEKITFNVVGYGHGVGMSQTGADSLAKQGKSAEEIIKHFYTDIEIKTVNEI